MIYSNLAQFLTAFVKQYSSAVCPGPYQGGLCLERAIWVRAARQVCCPQQRHYFPKRFLNCWHSSFFYDSSCPTFQGVLESSCLQFCLPRNCCLKFFQLSFPWTHISNSFHCNKEGGLVQLFIPFYKVAFLCQLLSPSFNCLRSEGSIHFLLSWKDD